MSDASLRSDILVSICFDDFSYSPASAAALKAVAAEIDSRYRFWEILVACVDGRGCAEDSLLQDIRNLRLIRLSGNSSTAYARRYALATRAIGDVVVMTSLDELPALDLPGMIRDANDSNSMVSFRSGTGGALNKVIVGLGRVAGFRVDAARLRTIAIPKEILGLILRHPSREIALRFPPINPSFALLDTEIAAQGTGLSLRKDLKQRLFLLERLMTGAAPSVLRWVGYLSVVVVVIALIYAIYAVVIFLTRDTAEGWFTTSLAISGTTGFLGIALMAITSGINRLIELLVPAFDHLMVQERGSLELFRELEDALNVERDARADSRDESGR